MEARIAQHMLERPSDFAEGVRATLVDKDNAPRWRYVVVLGGIAIRYEDIIQACKHCRRAAERGGWLLCRGGACAEPSRPTVSGHPRGVAVRIMC